MATGIVCRNETPNQQNARGGLHCWQTFFATPRPRWVAFSWKTSQFPAPGRRQTSRKGSVQKISKLHARELEPSTCHIPLPDLILPGNGCASGFRIQFFTWSDSVHMIVAQSAVSRAVFSSWSRYRVSNVACSFGTRAPFGMEKSIADVHEHPSLSLPLIRHQPGFGCTSFASGLLVVSVC